MGIYWVKLIVILRGVVGTRVCLIIVRLRPLVRYI